MGHMTSAAAALVAPGKGILAADEAVAALPEWLIPAGQRGRRACRELLVTTPGLAAGVSGVILCDEALGQQLTSGETFPEAVRELGMLVGVTADAGFVPLAGTEGETVSEGLDGLAARLREYARLGAQFAQWRAVVRIGSGSPSGRAVRANAQAMGRFAAACQHAGLAAVVAPEVHMAGGHSLGQCETVTSMVLLEVMSEVHEYGADFEGVVLRPNMAVPGHGAGGACPPADVAEATVGTLNGIPVALAGVAFLDGGQEPGQATQNLAAMQDIPHLWPLTFGFGRGLAGPALAAWRGHPARYEEGQRLLAHQVAVNVAALTGSHPRPLALGLA